MFKTLLKFFIPECLCLRYVDGYALSKFLFLFCFGTTYSAIFFAMAKGATISSSLCRQYRSRLSLSFFNVFDEQLQNWTFDQIQ